MERFDNIAFSFIVGAICGLVLALALHAEYAFHNTKNEYPTLSYDIIYVDKNGYNYHITNENGGLDITTSSLKEKDRILSMLCEIPTNSFTEMINHTIDSASVLVYREKIRTLQSLFQ